MAETTSMHPEAAEAQPTVGKQLKQQTATVREDLRELGRLTKEASQEKLQQAKQTASEYLERSRDKASAVEDSVVSYVREKPIKSVLLAAGAGALLGFLLSRR